jgi:molybdate transport system substrate-binding protein
MRSQFFRTIVALSTLLVLFARAGVADPPGQKPIKTDLTVSAAISLKDALEDIKKLYQVENRDTNIIYNFGASGSLQQQIEQGAPVDLFLSAAPKQMDALEAKGLLLPGTRLDLVRNRIVLVVPKDSHSVSSFQDLTRSDVERIALGEPSSVPAGKYAGEVLTYFGIYEQVKPKAVLAKDVRQVLTYVETGNVDAGIVYFTDAISSAQVKIVAEAPRGSHSPVIYPVAVLKDSKNPQGAQDFEKFLASPKARAVFEKHGFAMAQ